VLQADANLIATYNALKQVNAEVKALEKTQTSLEDDLKMAMGEAETLVSPTGEVMALWKNTKPTMKFNAKAFQQDDPAGYAKYMEQTTSTRRFSVK
jgi:predicted phage-related endonuclease